MAEQKKNSSEEKRQICPDCKRVVLELIQFVGSWDNEAFQKVCMKKKCGCGATRRGKADYPNDSAVPKAEVKKCGDQPIGVDEMLLLEETENCVGGLQPLSPSMKRDSLQKRENKKKLLEEMMRKYPQLVAYQADDGDLGDFGVDFDICCTECPASFSDLDLAEQHFEDNIHDKRR